MKDILLGYLIQRLYLVPPALSFMCRFPIPCYREDRYELFRMELLWWEDVNAGIADRQLRAVLAIK